MRPGFPLVIALLGLLPPPAGQGDVREFLEEILLVEDRRAQGENDITTLVKGLSHTDSRVMRVALRALGRLERPGLSPHLFPLLNAPLPEVRMAAAEAIAQAAQGIRRDSTIEENRSAWPALLGALTERYRTERDPGVRGMLALSLGRLPYRDRADVESVRPDLIRACGEKQQSAVDLCRGAETMVRATWRRFPLGEAEVRALRAVVRDRAARTVARRHALGALVISQAADDSTLARAFSSADAELRRLAQSGVRRSQGDWRRSPVLSGGMRDPDPAVRLEALRALERAAGPAGCSRFRMATSDRSPHVALMGIDLLGGCGGDSAAVRSLESRVVSRESSAAHSWHFPAHALLALARAAPARAAELIPEMAVSPVWESRMYAARAASVTRDTATLALLAGDLSPNVREAAIAGLRASLGHRGDSYYRQALAALDYQLVLTAAQALEGTPDQEAATTALIAALGRLSVGAAETSRDARIAILVRLRETGTAARASGLMPYLEDFDTMVADSAAAILTAWTGTRWVPEPRPQSPDAVSLPEVEALRGVRLHVVLRTGRSFDIEFLVDQAPVTSVRIMRLVKRRYYDDLTFHRVAPNFVLQGGSPGANEYSGIPSFMRDELSATSHARGTLGVSTRGRDTGDGQIFINLRDNPRLDYDYTVWGRVVAGLETIDGILEGASILRVEIRSR